MRRLLRKAIVSCRGTLSTDLVETNAICYGITCERFDCLPGSDLWHLRFRVTSSTASMSPPRPARRARSWIRARGMRPGHALELPDDDGRVEVRPGDSRR